MSTRGCVAIGTQRIWSGVRNNMDSYPTYLGVQVTTDLLDILLGNNPRIKSLKSFSDMLLKYNDWKDFKKNEIPYHLDHLTNKNCDPLFIEWIYILDLNANSLKILTNFPTARKDRNNLSIYRWHMAAVINLMKIKKIIYTKSNKDIIDYVKEMMNQISRMVADPVLPFETLYYPIAGEMRSTR